MERDPNDYSVKEILTEFVMPALNDLRARQESQKTEIDGKIDNLESWKNKTLGAIILIVAFIVPVSVPVLTAAMHG